MRVLCAGVVLFSSLSLAAQQPASPKPSPEIKAPHPNPRKARAEYEKGRKAESGGDWEAALEAYAEAAKWQPSDREYLLRRDVARSHVVQRYVDRAERDAVAGRLAEARGEMRAAIATDPGNALLHERLAQLETPTREEVKRLWARPAGPVRLEPEPGTRSFDYRGETQGAYLEVAGQFGVNVAFDIDLRSRPVRLRIRDVDFAAAMRVLGDMAGTFWRPLTPHLFFVAENTPQKRKDYEPSILRTVLLPASSSPEDMAEILRLVRDIVGIERTELDTRTRTLTLRASPRALAIASELIRELEQPRGELILEINVLEVDRTLARQLGITPPQRGQVFTLSKQQIQEAQQSVQGLIDVLTQVFGLPSSLSGLGSSQIASLVGSGQLGLSALIPPLLAFGGGRTTFLATLPGAAANFAETLSLIRHGRRILLRAEDGRPATFFVGDRVPIALALLSNSLGSAQFVPGVSSSAFPRTDFPTGAAPVAVVAADFNRDGKTDLAVANHADNTVSILLGQGNGKLGAKTDVPVGHAPVALAAGDFNADGNPDLAVVNEADNTLTLLLGNGDGTFRGGATLATGKNPVAVLAADFNGDGRLDLAVANHNDNTVSVFLGRGDGTFLPRTDLATAAGPAGLAAADLNGDGHPDLIVAEQTANAVSAFLGNGDGTFRARADFTTAAGPVSVAAADFNGDGRLDLAVADQSANTVSVLLGNGDGTFGTKEDFPTGARPASVVAADFNIDGRPDLAVANQSDNTVSILIGLGDGTFAPKFDLPTGSGPTQLAAADLNADNRLDLAIVDQTANTVTVILNSTAFLPPSGLPQQPFPGSEYLDLGLKVKATPRLHPDDEVTLQLHFEIRSLTGASVNGIPVISNRTVDQTVRLRENETSVLAGILQQQEMRAINGSPGIAALGAAGLLAGNRTTQVENTELLILVTPRRIRLAPHLNRSIYAAREAGEIARSRSPSERLRR